MKGLWFSIRSDAAVKQILLIMNERQGFIIEDLDDNHLVIKADEEYRVRRELEAEVRYMAHCIRQRLTWTLVGKEHV